MKKPQKQENTAVSEVMLQQAATNFSLARICESAVKKSLLDLGLAVGSAAIPPIGNTGKWTILLEVENSEGAHVSITFNGYAGRAISRSMEGL